MLGDRSETVKPANCFSVRVVPDCRRLCKIEWKRPGSNRQPLACRAKLSAGHHHSNNPKTSVKPQPKRLLAGARFVLQQTKKRPPNQGGAEWIRSCRRHLPAAAGPRDVDGLVSRSYRANTLALPVSSHRILKRPLGKVC